MSISAGTRLGPYEILAPIGKGGMGEVWKARDTKLDREVAIKVLPAALAQDPERLARFEREAKVLASLNLSNIAQIYRIEEWSAGRALVMELVPGQTLKGPIPLEIALKYAKQIAEALEAAHEKGIVHRDLKPANIMITPAGSVKVLDFGLAAVTQSTPADSVDSPTLTMSPTRAGTILGTAPYMSPEQVRGKPVDKRADIWAFGVVLYEMITGQQLFHGETVSDTLAAILKEEPSLDRVPPPIQRMLKRCLEKDPKKRLRDIGDVWTETATEPAQANRLPWVIVGVLGLFVVALGFVVWSLLRGASQAGTIAYRLDLAPPEGESLQQDALSGMMAVSPDGHTVAFIAESKGTRRVWLRPLDAPAARSLPGTELADGLFWSPDSRRLGFIAGNKLEAVDIATGSVKEIYDAGRGTVRGASWNAAGTIIFGFLSPYGIQRILADGGSPSLVVDADLKTEVSQTLPQFLPDGRHFLYWVRGTQPNVTGVYVGDLNTAADKQGRKPILIGTSIALYAPNPGRSTGYLLFLRGKTLFAQQFDADRLSLGGMPRVVAEDVGAMAGLGAFSVSQNGVLLSSAGGGAFRTVSIVARDGTTLENVGKPDAYTSLALSPDERSVALTRWSPEGPVDLWLVDLARGLPVRFTNELAAAAFPVWSPDGKELLFSALREGSYRIYRKSIIAKGEAERMLPDDGSRVRTEIATAWVREGNRIIVGTDRNGNLLLEAFTPGTKPVSIAYSRAELQGATVSPSGRWIAFSANDTGAYELYVQALSDSASSTSPKVRISAAGGVSPLWSADGKELFFNTPDDHLMSVTVKENGQRFEAGEPRTLFALGGSSVYIASAVWAPIANGQRFVVLRSTVPTERENRIHVTINWPASVEARP